MHGDAIAIGMNKSLNHAVGPMPRATGSYMHSDEKRQVRTGPCTVTHG
jgi:hypothetical protein